MISTFEQLNNTRSLIDGLLRKLPQPKLKEVLTAINSTAIPKDRATLLQAFHKGVDAITEELSTREKPSPSLHDKILADRQHAFDLLSAENFEVKKVNFDINDTNNPSLRAILSADGLDFSLRISPRDVWCKGLANGSSYTSYSKYNYQLGLPGKCIPLDTNQILGIEDKAQGKLVIERMNNVFIQGVKDLIDENKSIRFLDPRYCGGAMGYAQNNFLPAIATNFAHTNRNKVKIEELESYLSQNQHLSSEPIYHAGAVT